MDKEKYICPGCRVKGNWEHKCHSNQFGSCDCPDCREGGTPGRMDWQPRSCNCKSCAEDKVIERFQNMFSEEDQDLICDFLTFRSTFRNCK